MFFLYTLSFQENTVDNWPEEAKFKEYYVCYEGFFFLFCIVQPIMLNIN